jgi:hypothetical protein
MLHSNCSQIGLRSAHGLTWAWAVWTCRDLPMANCRQHSCELPNNYSHLVTVIVKAGLQDSIKWKNSRTKSHSQHDLRSYDLNIRSYDLKTENALNNVDYIGLTRCGLPRCTVFWPVRHYTVTAVAGYCCHWSKWCTGSCQVAVTRHDMSLRVHYHHFL